MQRKGQEKSSFQNFLDFLKSKKNIPLLIGGVVLGVMLLIFAGAGTTTEKSKAEGESLLAEQTGALSLYESKLEKELELLCESVAGVSDATVMVGFSGGYRLQYLSDADGEPVTVGGGSSEAGIFATLIPPAVSGVGVVCRGGNRPDVQAKLVELISTALGIPSNRVYITGK